MNPLNNLPLVTAPQQIHNHAEPQNKPVAVREGQMCPACQRVKQFNVDKPDALKSGQKVRLTAQHSPRRGRGRKRDPRYVEFY